ncbi:MAG: hypothetical protein N3B13_02165 [Deltaproteobacteria bacterium]|nr:hypothetical protein [Deltaproteobacteria bacterium]
MDIHAQTERKNKVTLVILLILFNTYFFQHYDNIPNPNEQSRIYLTAAIVDNHKISIDEQIKRFGDTIDISRHNGKAYCDKAPGLSFLAVPFYAALKIISKIFGFELTYPVILKFLRVTLLGIPSALFSLIMLSVIKRHIKDFQLSLVITAFYSTGTIAYTYSNLLFGHQAGAMAAFLLFYLITKDSVSGWHRLLLCGFIAGLSVIIEYPLIIIASVLSVYQLLVLDKKSKYIFFIIGGVAAASVLMIYNKSAFGSVISTGYSHIANPTFAQFHREGILGITTPKISAFFGSFFSSMRGLFYFMPALIFSLAGIYYMIKNNLQRGEGILILFIFLLMTYFISSFSYWQAGGTISQRHLTALIPFMMIPLAIFTNIVIEKNNKIILLTIASLILFSMLLIPYATIPFPFFSVAYPNPLFELPLNLWRWGAIPPNIATLTGLKGLSSAVPFIIIWLLFASYITYHLLSYSKGMFSPLFYTISVICITFILITGASFVAKEKNYETKMKDVIGIMENFRPGKNSCEYVIENRSVRFSKTTCYAFLKRSADGIKSIREAENGL